MLRNHKIKYHFIVQNRKIYFISQKSENKVVFWIFCFNLFYKKIRKYTLFSDFWEIKFISRFFAKELKAHYEVKLQTQCPIKWQYFTWKGLSFLGTYDWPRLTPQPVKYSSENQPFPREILSYFTGHWVYSYFDFKIALYEPISLKNHKIN